MAVASYRRDCIRRSRSASRRHPIHRLDLRSRLVQTRRRSVVRCNHSKQERLGLRLFKVHHALGGASWLHSSDHDQWIIGTPVVSLRRVVLLQG